MSEQLFFCCDLARRDPANDRMIRLEGWCFATSDVRGLYFEHNDIGYEELPHRFSRPDVGQAYPSYPQAAHSGFRLTTASNSLPDHPNLLVRVEGSVHRVPLNLATHDVQTVELSDRTLLDRSDQVVRELDSAGALEDRFLRSLGKLPGLTLRLDIINKCNLRCVMCHFSDETIFKRPTRQLTAQEFEHLFDEIGPSVRHVVLSCGDEPLLSRHLPAILTYLAREHPHVQVEFCTNAMLMNAQVRRLIMETGVARLLFSIDAVSKPLLESIRVGCRYEQLVGNIMAMRHLRDACGVTWPAFVFNYVMMNRNIHEAPAFVTMAHDLGAESIDFRHMVPIGNNFPAGEVLSDQPERYNFFRAQILAESRRLNVPVYLPPPFVGTHDWVPSRDESSVDWGDFKRVRPTPNDETGQISLPPGHKSWLAWEGSVAEEFATTFCNRPFSEIMVRDQTEVLPCPWHEKTLGYLNEGKTLAEIFHGEAFQQLRRNMLRPEGDPACANCPIKSQHLPNAAS
ncbi:MAG TPA: radical SAM protein [Chthoniobacterales bacterium]|jgi:MoaA/NifB/PqqE/SkfB family radical SAM enzyme